MAGGSTRRDNVFARDVRRVVREQEGGDAAHLAGDAELEEERASGGLLLELRCGVELAAETRLDEAGAQPVDTDAFGAELDGERLDEAQERGLANTICRDREGWLEATDRRDNDDGGVLLQVRVRLLDELPGRLDVDVKDLGPLVVGQIDDAAHRGRDGGVGHEAVDVAKLFHGHLDQVFDLVGLWDVLF